MQRTQRTRKQVFYERRKFYEKYEKPAILFNANVAEGIYMASGSKVTASGLTVTQDWKTGGTATCNVDLSGANLVSVYFYSAPSSATLNVQTNGVDINQLQIVSISSSN